MASNILNNRYKTVRTIGSGGFGETFLAEDTQMPSGRYCVIKQLKPINSDPKIYQIVQERFQREAVILEELGRGSNQIPQLYAYFSEGGQFYLVQEWIEGETLSQKLQQQGTLSESAVKAILTSILPVLDYVHSKRIVHRDIKPDNIIFRHQDGKPVLIDFGAVRETMGTLVTTGGNVTSSIVIGTPGFMPAEQSTGRAVYASDIYSLGLTAIYLLTGRIPQELDSDPRTGEVLWSQYALNVSPTFAAILDKAIQYNPRDRFASAKEMLEALQTGVAPIAATMASLPNNQHSFSQPTTLSPEPQRISDRPVNSNSGQQAIIFGSLIMGGLIAAAIVLSSVLNRPTQTTTEQTAKQSTNSPLPASVNSVSPQPASPLPTAVTPIPTPVQSAYTPPPVAPAPAVQPANPAPYSQVPLNPTRQNQSRSLGWVRLGAVNNTSGRASVGEMLIKTNQPVTISPAIVPSIGNRVTVINGVNLRQDRPQKPNYQLADKVGVLLAGQQVVIIQIDALVDPRSTSPYTAVWAEVALP